MGSKCSETAKSGPITVAKTPHLGRFRGRAETSSLMSDWVAEQLSIAAYSKATQQLHTRSKLAGTSAHHLETLCAAAIAFPPFRSLILLLSL